jgi:hypothetical protein
MFVNGQSQGADTQYMMPEVFVRLYQMHVVAELASEHLSGLEYSRTQTEIKWFK